MGVVDSIPGRYRPDHFEVGGMKKLLWSIALLPVTVIGGWLATSLSDRWAAALDEIDYELGLDDA